LIADTTQRLAVVGAKQQLPSQEAISEFTEPLPRPAIIAKYNPVPAFSNGTSNEDSNESLGDYFMQYPPPDIGPANKEFVGAITWGGAKSGKGTRLGFDVNWMDKAMDDQAKDWQPFEPIIGRDKQPVLVLLESLRTRAREKKQVETAHQFLSREIANLRAARHYDTMEVRLKLGLQRQLEARVRGIDSEMAITRRQYEAYLKKAAKSVEGAFTWDYDPNNLIGAAKAANEIEMERRAEHARLMNMVGWGDYTYDAVYGDRPPGNPDDDEESKWLPAPDAPRWFVAMDAKAKVGLNAVGVNERYRELITRVARHLQLEKSHKGDPKDNAPLKNWHEKNKAWPYENWRERGGLWFCRSGPEASEAEKACKQCHPPAHRPNQLRSKRTMPAAQLQEEKDTMSEAAWCQYAMAEMQKATAEEMEMDKQFVKERMRKEDDELHKRRLSGQSQYR
jgi:hypothetical protein